MSRTSQRHSLVSTLLNWASWALCAHPLCTQQAGCDHSHHTSVRQAGIPRVLAIHHRSWFPSWSQAASLSSGRTLSESEHSTVHERGMRGALGAGCRLGVHPARKRVRFERQQITGSKDASMGPMKVCFFGRRTLSSPAVHPRQARALAFTSRTIRSTPPEPRLHG